MVNKKTINAAVLSRMFLAGAKNLEAKKEWINELNVFPVPDGDTGTNMTLTIMSAASEVGSLEDPDMETLAKAISSGSLRGARGNSGVILSQLLRGFTRSVRESEELDAIDIANAMEKGVETAYKAVMKPKEGTLLTVAKEAAYKALEVAGDAEDLESFFHIVFQHAEETLARTPEMLPVLKEAGVVDSGGQGLLEVLRGAIDGYLGKEVDYTEFARGAAPKVQNNPDKAKAEGLEELPIIPLHGLRHSCATLLNYLEVNIIEISKTLGHSTCSTTMNIYAHSFEEQQEEVATKVNEFLRLNA